MEKARQEHVIGVPVSNAAYGIEELELPRGEPAAASSHHGGFIGSFRSRQKDAKIGTNDKTSKFSRKGGKFAQGIKEHVTLGPKLSETVKGKLTLGARILHAGGIEKLFHQSFAVAGGETLLRASQCHLSTTAGPIAGVLFISSEKIAFRSDRPVAATPHGGGGAAVRVPYKVVIPLRRVARARPSENKHKPEQKYVQVVTTDGFEFWFMGFVSYHRSLRHLEQAIAQSQ